MLRTPSSFSGAITDIIAVRKITGKNTLWEQAALTPTAIRVPGSRHAGKTCARSINPVDFYPTLADYCGLQQPLNKSDGLSLRPLLQNRHGAWTRPALTTVGQRYISIRDERYRYIHYPDGSEEPYDDGDPHEFKNSVKHPDVATVKQTLRGWKPQTFATSFGGRIR